MSPTITPSVAGAASYTITDSAAFVADLQLDSNVLDTRSLTLSYPDPTAGLSVVLRHGAIDIDLDALTGTDASVPGREVTASTATPTPGITQLTCNITNINGANGINEPWQVLASASSPVTWGFGVDSPVTSTVTRLMCDPAVAFSTAPPATALENQTVNLVAADATIGTVVGTPIPSVVYRWEHNAPIAIMDLPFCGSSQTRAVHTPGVYDDVAVPITLTAGLDTTCGGLATAFLRRSVTAAPMTIKARPQQIALVLDRSGSMGLESRWDNAVTAASMVVNMLAVIREDVSNRDKVGIVVFEDDGGWHPAPISPKIQQVLPLTLLKDAPALIKDASFFGLPGSNTPIGDGLVAGMDMLAGGGPEPNARFTLILLTDGEENAGTVQIDAGQAGIPTFEAVRSLGLGRATVNAGMRLFTVALGSAANNAAINRLAVTGNGVFHSIANPAELAAGFAQILSVAQEVNNPTTRSTPLIGTADVPTGQAVYFTTATGADRMAVAVLADTTGSAALKRWNGSSWVAEGTVAAAIRHFVGAVTDVPAFGGGAVEWQVTFRDATSTLQPLATGNVLAYEDLHVKADFTLDKGEYRTLDPMQLTVRLRHDGAPILGATVRAVLDAPDEGIGDVLANAALQLSPSTEPRGKDHPTGRGALVEEIMRRNGWKQWPHQCPKGIFVDGTDELHDRDGDGNYTNTFARVFTEGSYNWELFVDGTDTHGNPVERTIARSTQAGVSIDPRTTRITVTSISKHPSGMRAVRASLVPQDRLKNKLGPGFDKVVIFSLRGGIFEHVWAQEPAPVFDDGSYQRVVLFDGKRPPELQVSVTGTTLPGIRLIEDRKDDPVR
jgi:von Willebrand factor type A domain